MQAARANYPSAAHLFPFPPIASPPPGLNDYTIATLTAGKTIPDRQVAILRMLEPKTLQLLVNPAPHPDDRSTTGSLTINTVDYGTVEANIAYPIRAAFAAAAATTPTTHTVSPPSYPPPSPHPDFLLTEQGDVVFTPETDKREVAALAPYAAYMATVFLEHKILAGLPKQLAMYRSFMLHILGV